MAELDHIISEYIEGTGELLLSAESGLLQMESGEMGEAAAQDAFRAINAIKGGAAMAGLAKIERLARQMEGLLDLCRNGDLEPAQPVTDSLLQASDVLASLCGRVEEHASIDIQDSASAMQAVLAAELGPAYRYFIRKAAAGSLPNWLPHFEISEYCLAQKRRQGNLYFIHLGLARIEERGFTPIQFLNQLLSMGEVLDAIINQASGDMTASNDTAVSIDFFYAAGLEQDLLQTALRLDREELRQLKPDDFAAKQASPSGTAPESTPRESPAPEPVQPRLEANPDARPAQAVPWPKPSQDRTAFSNLEAPLESDDDSEGHEYLTFTLGNENYGVDILSVQEIITLPRLTSLPRSPRHVLGVMNLRGMVVPVVDMRLRLNLPRQDGIEPVVMVMQTGSKLMGAVVDSVSDVMVFQETEIQDPPDFAAAIHREYLRGLCRQGDDLIVILEFDQLLAPEA